MSTIREELNDFVRWINKHCYFNGQTLRMNNKQVDPVDEYINFKNSLTQQNKDCEHVCGNVVTLLPSVVVCRCIKCGEYYE